MDKSSQKWQPSFSQGGREKIEKDVSHRSHGTEEPATLVVVVAAVVFVVVSRERDRVIYIEAGKRPFTKTVMKKEERNDEFSMREEQRPRSPDGRDNRRLVTPRASLAIIETGRGLVRIISLTRQLIGRRFKVSPFLSLHPISPPRKLGILSNTLAFESQLE